MTRFLLRRLGWMAITLWVVFTASFFLMKAVPGGPLDRERVLDPEIEENLKSRKETDRIMWFSMWAVLSVASFGIAWFPLIYYSIKRRNDLILCRK
mgnify:CR=1 FL=1